MYVVLMIAAVIVISAGSATVVWLTKLLWPPKPREERIERSIEEARRRWDRLRY